MDPLVLHVVFAPADVGPAPARLIAAGAIPVGDVIATPGATGSRCCATPGASLCSSPAAPARSSDASASYRGSASAPASSLRYCSRFVWPSRPERGAVCGIGRV